MCDYSLHHVKSRSARVGDKARLADLAQLSFQSPTDFAKLIADDTEKWGKVIRALNIKAD